MRERPHAKQACCAWVACDDAPPTGSGGTCKLCLVDGVTRTCEKPSSPTSAFPREAPDLSTGCTQDHPQGLGRTVSGTPTGGGKCVDRCASFQVGLSTQPARDGPMSRLAHPRNATPVRPQLSRRTRSRAGWAQELRNAPLDGDFARFLRLAIRRSSRRSLGREQWAASAARRFVQQFSSTADRTVADAGPSTRRAGSRPSRVRHRSRESEAAPPVPLLCTRPPRGARRAVE